MSINKYTKQIYTTYSKSMKQVQATLCMDILNKSLDTLQLLDKNLHAPDNKNIDIMQSQSLIYVHVLNKPWIFDTTCNQKYYSNF